ncbi:ABC transporter permease [Cryobacterium sp. PH31-L1]|uniref:ABC transporter permease n=1 Tax=Cryobacterium sp. PH31-L1 TaxID=3046199 RepID=UPI0024B878AA|nr:ABC transporter permease [Cryobacterium sp. PH31-L1]MDJ0377047.1 FtsX-like permease family protein [Cryobacterium sp. PH31-L1]
MNLTVHTLREHAPSILVAGLSTAFGVSLISITGVLAEVIGNSGLNSATLTFILSFIAAVFIVIALYVGALVTANTFATIIAGRVRTIALLRLIGASAAMQRRAVAREGFTVGVAGAVMGGIVGVLFPILVVSVGVQSGTIPPGTYSYLSAQMLLPVVAVALTTTAASWAGSRRVLSVSPMDALGAAGESSLGAQSERRTRNRVALAVFLVGDVILVLGMLVGLVHPLGVLIGLLGGILSFSGVVLGAAVVMPRALRVVGRVFGTSATARLARENAVRYPERSARTTIGLVIGVTLITTFAVTVASYQTIIKAAQEAQPGVYEGVDPILAITVGVFSVLMGFSALIAAVGMVNNLSLNVLQRTRELGLLRALGFTARQIRRMILIESAQLSAAAVVVGLVLGTFYGWAGAQSLIGGIQGSPGIVMPTVPLLLVAVIAVAAAALTAVASVAPSRRATRITPVAALATE